jgi:hypothetical protein
MPPPEGSVWMFFENLFINLIMTGIIGGIITDNFGELRGKRCEIEDDTKNVCMICSIERTVLK